MYHNDLYHYGVKGMKWHKHLKRHEEPLLDRLGRDEKKDLENAREYRQYAENVTDAERYTIREQKKLAARDRGYGTKTSKRNAEVRESIARYETDQYMKSARLVIDAKRREQIAQWRYNQTVMGKIDKGKKKVVEFLKRGFKK